jgi:TP901 family phage tail tape measure protein
MPTEVASAYVTLMPSAKGFGAATSRAIDGDVGKAGVTGGKKAAGGIKSGLLGGVSKLGGPLALAFAAVGIGKIVSDSISAEADFSKTIRQIGVAADASAPQVDQLRKLAIQMGADTTFSAGEAADAILELAKGGISPAVIQGGALKSVMSLAAAGELELADAAGLTSAAMHTFNISAADSSKIADALAGGANASSANVSDLGQALTQAGTGAHSAGLNLNETVGALAALADKGIQGSDAGTSLKTMLSRLVPTTAAAAKEMKKLGLDFTDAKGNFVPITNVAEQLHTKLDKLSESQRTSALGTIFGSDAIRAATSLYDLGGRGLEKYISATEKTGNAQKLADAAMGGTSGALERLSGSFDTAKLAVGTFLAPATVAVANGLANALGVVATKLSGLKLPDLSKLFGGGAGGAGGLLTSLAPLIAGAKSYVASLVASFNALKGPVLAFFAALVPPIQDFANKLIGVLGPGLAQIGQLIQGTLVPAIIAILPVLAPVAAFLINIIGGALIGALKGAITVIKGVFTAISGILNVFAGIFTGNWSLLWTGIKQIIGGVLQAIWGLVQIAWNIGIVKAFRAGFAAIGGLFKAGTALIKGTWTGGLRAISAAPGAAWSLIRGVFSRGISATGALIRNGVTTYIGMWRAGLTGIASAIRAGVSTAIGIFRSLPGKIKGAVGNLGGLLRDAGAKLVQGLVDGIKSKIGAVTDAAGALASKIKGFFPGSPVKTGPLTSWNGGATGKKLVALLADGITKATPKAVKAMESLASKLGAKVDSAQASLAAKIKTMTDYASGIAGNNNLASITSITAPTAKSVVASMKAQLKSVKAFRDNLALLQKRGINKTTLQQLAEAGVEQGGAAAAALAAGGPGAVKQVNALQKQLNKVSNDLGTRVSHTLYGAGVEAAKGLVSGLESQAKALQRIANDLGKKIAAAVRKALDIHSPSRIMHYIGKVQTAGALATGLKKGTPAVEAAALRMGASVVAGAGRTVRAPAFAGDAATRTGVSRGQMYQFGDVYAFTPESLEKQLDERQRRADALAPAF